MIQFFSQQENTFFKMFCLVSTKLVLTLIFSVGTLSIIKSPSRRKTHQMFLLSNKQDFLLHLFHLMIPVSNILNRVSQIKKIHFNFRKEAVDTVFLRQETMNFTQKVVINMQSLHILGIRKSKLQLCCQHPNICLREVL